MGHEIAQKHAAGGGDGGPRRGPIIPRGQQLRKTLNNIKVTILCGFITIVVLRGYIGINLGGGSSSAETDAVRQNLLEETNRLLAHLRSDIDPDDLDDPLPDTYNSSTYHTYTLGAKVTTWDTDRSTWLQQNPSFPSHIQGKPRILLVTGSPPKPCDNPIGDHYLLKSIKNKIDYCRLHGIEIAYNMVHLDNELNGYWSKLPVIRNLMLSHPEVEWIWWMDSDALFTDMSFEIPIGKYAGSNLVVHGYPDLLYDKKDWIALSTGNFLLRNCQWSLDLLDAWAPMGPKGPVREEAGKVLTANLKGRPADFEADDQSALIYLLVSKRGEWEDKVFLENSYYLHGFWGELVDGYDEMIDKYDPGLGDKRRPFVTHFVGCKSCGSFGDYPVKRCLSSIERAYNFADNQVLNLYGFRHRGLLSPKIKRFRNETVNPLELVDQFGIRQRSVHETRKPRS